jgi:hypothetical protein
MKRGYRSILFLGIVLALVSLSSCYFVVDTGDVYLAYYYDPANPIISISDNNIFMPLNFVNNDYYKVQPGTYTGQYTTHLNVTWQYKYKLWVDFSDFGDSDDLVDAIFQLWLKDDGPLFLDRTFDAPKSIEGGQSIIKSAAVPDFDGMLDQPDGVIEQTKNGYTMRLEYWKIE